MPLVGGANLNGRASGDPTALRFDRPYRASLVGPPMDGQSTYLFARQNSDDVTLLDFHLTWAC
eukprot:2800688-Pleurochrysis_carterae.AAC.10